MLSACHIKACTAAICFRIKANKQQDLGRHLSLKPATAAL